jgi:glycosyltransferase involved in cell wall biosynthesis
MKLAFIVQRYGSEILGGSEYHCRLIAERMAARHEVEVLTTCARDYITWTNEYPEGPDRVRGVTVRRFANERARDLASFNRYSEWIFHHPHTRDDELEWLKQQGPWCPALQAYLEREHATYDALIFFTYLYAPTVLGLRVDPARSLLVPTAHDEPAIHLDLYRDMFRLPAGLAYNTPVERAFLKSTFDVDSAVEEIVGCGVDLPQQRAPRARRGTEAGRREASLLDTLAEDEAGTREDEAEAAEAERASRHAERGAVFRRRHRLYGPLMLYGGRIDPGKGCEELIEYFSTYIAQGGTGTLALMGVKLMRLPEEPFIRFAGLLSERERVEALEAATVVIVPSPYESLSLLALEAFASGTPVLANARSAVLVEHCRQSNAGLYYADRDEFVECLKLLVADGRLRAAMGRNGREYVRANYRWDVILGKYERLIAAIRSGAGDRGSGAGEAPAAAASERASGQRSRGWGPAST